MNFWYKKSWLCYLLLPFSALFWGITYIRRYLYQTHKLRSYRASVPVVIVGNLSVGGNGKTPVTIWLVQQLQARGLRVGVISRGYGSKSKVFPLLVDAQSNPIYAGDEPVLIAQRTGTAVAISPNRQQAIEMLLQNQVCDVIISDDGLQHYKLQRDIEIVVVDAERGLGNGLLLPAGPLRELPSRLNEVDLVISNGGVNQYSQAEMRLVPSVAINLLTGEKQPLVEFTHANAIAGIGNPPRFFAMLRSLNIQLNQTFAFADHQDFSMELLRSLSSDLPCLMTEKDAVKCMSFAQANWWYIPVEAEITATSAFTLLDNISEKIK
ncbi:MAG: tetraacyldisaccharide 4'-kinase [Pasteurellaceae bacterium]|nr:tetraacyldisaccharide 4'-kinase [Pasteurellaceae bacterium]